MSEEKELSKSEKLEIAFAKQRLEISTYLKENITTPMGSINNVADIQVHILSQRQLLVDKSNEMRVSIVKRNKSLASTRKQKYRFYKLDYDIKLNDYEIKNHIEADLEDSYNVIKMIENQITFYKETIETLDKSIWMIKYLIDTEKFKSGSF
mgnify:FL=1|tara:strand:- start:4020 stop:4475 length:456 start_codon:yes stop_codon:yes gene_type:complete